MEGKELTVLARAIAIRLLLVVVVLLEILSNLTTAEAAAQPELPRGVPEGAKPARVWGYLDGDSFRVRIDGKTEDLVLIGIDAPELRNKDGLQECYAAEAASRVRELLPKKTTVYLESEHKDRDWKGNLLRYVWVPGEGTSKAYLLNTKLVRDGFAGFRHMGGYRRYDDRLEEAQKVAQERNRGLWGTCGGVHVVPAEAETVPTPEPVTAPSPSPLTAAERTYLLQISDQIDRLIQGRDGIVAVFDIYGMQVLYDTDAQVLLAAGLAMWLNVIDEARTMDVPPRFADWHNNYYLVWLGKTESAIWSLADCIDNLNVASCDVAVAIMQDATTFEKQVVAELEAILSQIPGAEGTI
ncbi:MAG: hypothetical protein C4345_06120 [Chloroflexota bacterium]